MKQKNKIPKKWKKEILKDIAIVFDGQHTTPKYVDYGIPFYSVENIVSGEPVKYISKEEYKINTKRNKPLKGDILISRIGTLCKNIIATWEGNYAIYVTLALIRSKVRDVSNKFLHQFFQTHMYNKDFFSKSLLIAYPQKINMEDLEKTSVLIPPIKEQEKIVDILELWDKAIETTKKLIEQKKLQKKYLMQKLLTGKIRLKGFKDRWKKYKLGDVCDFISGFSFSSNDFCDRGILLIKISNISNGKIVLSDEDVYLPIDYVYKYKQFVIKQNDLLIAMSGATTGKLAINTSNKQLLLNQRVGIIRTLKFNQNFINQYLFAFKNKFLKMSYGGAQPNISSEDIKKIIIYIPQNLTEQKAIADILSTADNQINLLEQKLSKLELQKKGLMQKLLTGQIRVC